MKKNIKKIFALFLSLLLAISVFSSCKAYGEYKYYSRDEIRLNRENTTRIIKDEVIIYGDIKVRPYILDVGGIERKYNKKAYLLIPVPLWSAPEEDPDKFKKLIFNGRVYYQSSKMKKEYKDFIEDRAGRAEIICSYLDENFENAESKKQADAYKIKDISPEFLLAVKFEDDIFLYMVQSEDFKCKTLGEFLQKTNFLKNVSFNYFSMNYNSPKGTADYGMKESKIYKTQENKEIMQILSSCKNAPQAEEKSGKSKAAISLYYTAPLFDLGENITEHGSAEKMRVSTEGYLYLDYFLYAKSFYIGKENAQKIIEIAGKNKKAAKISKSKDDYEIFGEVLQINKKRAVINDGFMCKNPEDGRDYIYEFKNLNEYESFCKNIKIGDRVAFITEKKLSANRIIEPSAVYAIVLNSLEANPDLSNVAEDDFS